MGRRTKIQASDKATEDQFGGSVSIDGDYAIVGASGNSGTGAVYIYKRDASTGVWGSVQKIQASDKATSDYFGISVSIDGDYAIVGAFGDDSFTGAIYIYKRNISTGVWGDEQKIYASDKASDDRFGESVSINGDYAIVGARNEDTGGSNAGAAYIYKRNASTGVWGDEQKIQASDKASDDHFGGSVSINGDYSIVGARNEDTGGSNAGAAYIYKRNGTTWSQQQKIQASDKATNDQFGYSVSLNDTGHAIVGAYGDDSSTGAAYIYTAPNSVPKLTHDGYKLVVSGITPTSTTLKYFSNTYDIGSATNIYVKDTGAYTAEIGSAADFAFTSNTVSGTIKTIEPGFASRYQGSTALTYDGKLYAWGWNDESEAGVVHLPI